MNMEFGVFTFIIPDTIFNSVKKYMNYELEPDENSHLLFTYDNDPDMVKEFDMKTNHKMKKMWFSSRRVQAFPETFEFQIEKKEELKFSSSLFFEEIPYFIPGRGHYVLKPLKKIFYKHNHWANSKPSIYNCAYYINTPTKKYVFSILRISFNRYLFAYNPKYLDKTELEQIVFDLFIDR
jgi:hypothetical protein